MSVNTPAPTFQQRPPVGPFPKPLLAGYFGHGNWGDEAILALLREELGPAPFVSGPLPRFDNGVGRFHVFALIRALRRSGGLVLGGGELFQLRTSLPSLLYYWSLPALARLCRRPVWVFSLALDPDLPSWATKVTALVLRLARSVWVRDRTSYERLTALGVSASMMPDVVWGFPWVAQSRSGGTGRTKILWALRELGTKGEIKGAQAGPLPALGATLPHERGRGKNLFPSWECGVVGFQKGSDGGGAEWVRSFFSIDPRREEWRTLEDLLSIVSGYDLVVTMRYHGVIAATLARRPVLAVGGYGKVDVLADELGLVRVPYDQLSTVDWPGLVRSALERGAAFAGERGAKARSSLEELKKATTSMVGGGTSFFISRAGKARPRGRVWNPSRNK